MRSKITPEQQKEVEELAATHPFPLNRVRQIYLYTEDKKKTSDYLNFMSAMGWS